MLYCKTRQPVNQFISHNSSLVAMTPEQFSKALGPLPEKVALQPEIVDEKDCGAYLMQKILFFAEANDAIPAYLLIPKNLSKKTPAIYCHHQHDSNWELGKSEVVGLIGHPDQAYAKELAEQGFITFAPDAIAFEERQNNIGGGTGSYFELAKRIVNGQNLLSKTLFDISAGIDYLVSRPEVDADRIGFIGHSYGGRMALVAPAFDKRIKVSVSNCGCVNYKDSIEREIGIQIEFCVPKILQYGDVEDFVRLVAPCSLLVLATREDKFSLGAERLYEYAKDAFKPGTLKVSLYNGGHAFTSPMRKEAYQFLNDLL